MIFHLILLAAVSRAVPPRPQHDPVVESAGLSEKLDRPVRAYVLSAPDFLSALLAVGGRFEIPMGIEWERTPSMTRSIHCTWRDKTVRHIFESLTRGEPGYSVEVSDRVLHVFQGSVRHDRHNFLNLRLNTFQVENEYIGIAGRKLQARLHREAFYSPPVTAPARARPFGEGGSIFTGQGDRKVSFQEQNASVRAILDRFISVAGFKVWIATFIPGPPLPQTGLLRSASPTTGRPLPDPAQPSWELLMWGQNPY